MKKSYFLLINLLFVFNIIAGDDLNSDQRISAANQKYQFALQLRDSAKSYEEYFKAHEQFLTIFELMKYHTSERCDKDQPLIARALYNAGYCLSRQIPNSSYKELRTLLYQTDAAKYFLLQAFVVGRNFREAKDSLQKLEDLSDRLYDHVGMFSMIFLYDPQKIRNAAIVFYREQYDYIFPQTHEANVSRWNFLSEIGKAFEEDCLIIDKNDLRLREIGLSIRKELRQNIQSKKRSLRLLRKANKNIKIREIFHRYDILLFY